MIIIRLDLPWDSCGSRFSKGKSRYSEEQADPCLSKKLLRENLHSTKREIEIWVVTAVLGISQICSTHVVVL